MDIMLKKESFLPSIQKRLQVVGPVPGEPVGHDLSTALLRVCPGLPLLGPGSLLCGEHSEGDDSLGGKDWVVFNAFLFV